MNSTVERERGSASALALYSAYRESGDRWLGEVPAHWEVRRLRTIAEMRVSNVDKHSTDGERPVRLCNYVDVYKADRIWPGMPLMAATATAEEIEKFRLRSGDVLITKDSEAWNDIGVPALIEGATDDTICGYHLALLRPLSGRVSGGFLFRAIQSSAVACQFHVRANGVTRYGLTQDGIKSTWFPIPPSAEQAAIVRFLDHADRRIRRYIRAKEKLIALLEEQRQAVIHEAVTGRINVWTGLPHGRYKRSTIDSLQVVPDHWEARRLGQIARVFNGTTPSRAQPAYWENGTVPWLNSSKANDEIVVEASELVTEKAVRECSIGVAPSGAVILGLVGQGRTRGMSALLGIEAAINQNLAAIVPGPLVDGRFLHRLLTAFYANIREAGRGGNQEALNCELVSRLRLPIPPLVEQIEIVSRVEHALGKLKRGITRAGEEVGLIREYRSRLIADAVTGKLDVRDMAARLPELDPLAAGGDPVDGGDRDAGPVWTGERPTEQAGGRVAAGQ